MAKIITVGIMKGGTGKTTCVLNLAYVFACKLGLKVLCLDGDAQANLSMSLGKVDPNEQPVHAGMLFSGNSATSFIHCIVPSKYERIDLIPAKINMMFDANNISSKLGYFISYQDKYDRVTDERYDIILIDTPPALDNPFVYNALSISDYFIVPVEASSIYALQGLEQYLSTVNDMHRFSKRKMELMGILLNKFDARTTAGRLVEERLVRQFGNDVFKTRIPKTTSFDNSNITGIAAAADRKSTATRSFRKLAYEVILRGEIPVSEEILKDAKEALIESNDSE